MISLEDSVGLRVKITTYTDETFQGIIHSYNPQSGMISLVDDSSVAHNTGYSKDTNFRVVKSTFVKSVQKLSSQKISLPVETSKTTNKVDKFRSMHNKPAVIPLASIADSFKHGVSKSIAKQELEFNRRRIFGQRKISIEGESVFNQLFNLLPEGNVTFDKNDNIAIFGNHLLVQKSYRSENCRILRGTGEEEEQQLSYIRKVIKDIWNKLETERKGG
ncbi:hypothetical protein FOA43_004119 [Brettanomyces nanus]|uniref:AD domain-containing protein n=1 Tax=Eeniella nana TaxID=13502 RepID=A0A875S986_EENNA|nr:uncharacterized protein FOA43_004119 [Brettanomyces nanus]QPG76725.1 hypothetical protein FOA43_004119 [Brettanomyces nanus]